MSSSVKDPGVFWLDVLCEDLEMKNRQTGKKEKQVLLETFMAIPERINMSEQVLVKTTGIIEIAGKYMENSGTCQTTLVYVVLHLQQTTKP